MSLSQFQVIQVLKPEHLCMKVDMHKKLSLCAIKMSIISYLTAKLLKCNTLWSIYVGAWNILSHNLIIKPQHTCTRPLHKEMTDNLSLYYIIKSLY